MYLKNSGTTLGTKTKKRIIQILFFVELEGFEPSSKQAIHKPSTCLFFY